MERGSGGIQILILEITDAPVRSKKELDALLSLQTELTREEADTAPKKATKILRNVLDTQIDHELMGTSPDDFYICPGAPPGSNQGEDIAIRKRAPGNFFESNRLDQAFSEALDL
ncbi:hypothetical protein CVT26_006917 [Gymnopilus dilepis]|uniref:Uncharacterized protein n=1 Tax=Gymnopilus dilepis TaxID=231916 RepID=A0A409W6C8_9AGAR|nr:hypothetical protein CVT26_006917 [Gymnopilus dilepis]